MTESVTRVGGVAAAVVSVAMGTVATAQTRRADTPAAPTPPILAESLAGRDSFELYCAPCHGGNGRGHGPVAPALKTQPPDLTLLAWHNGGAFPREEVRAYITGAGRMLPSHGPAEMPVWGPTFRAFESDARTRVRIDNLVKHLASIQRRQR